MKTKFIALFLFGLLLFSCEEENPNLNNSNKLLGKWNWVESAGGIGGIISTPKSTGNSKMLEFNDSVYFYYVDSKLQNKGRFEIKKIKFENEQDSLTMIEYGSSSILQVVTFRSKDTLVLIDYLVDGYTHVYKRNR